MMILDSGLLFWATLYVQECKQWQNKATEIIMSKQNSSVFNSFMPRVDKQIKLTVISRTS